MQMPHCLGNVALLDHKTDINFRRALRDHADVHNDAEMEWCNMVDRP